MATSPSLSAVQLGATRAAFFYGTLMAPSVLERVTNRKRTSTSSSKVPPLKIQPAVLPGFRRHRVKYADYPAIVPVSSSSRKDNEEISDSDLEDVREDTRNQVRGTYVTGLVASDIRRLDAFEGSEYERRFVRVRLLPLEEGAPDPEAANGMLNLQTEEATSTGHREASDRTGNGEGESWATAETYVWISREDELEDQEWDFEQFVRERLYVWAGRDPGFTDADRVGMEDAKVQEGAVDTTGGRSIYGGQFEKMMAERGD